MLVYFMIWDCKKIQIYIKSYVKKKHFISLKKYLNKTEFWGISLFGIFKTWWKITIASIIIRGERTVIGAFFSPALISVRAKMLSNAAKHINTPTTTCKTTTKNKEQAEYTIMYSKY